jgi:hypothetical protein
MTGLILVRSGILIVEKRASSTMKQPIRIEAVILTALNNTREFKISRANVKIIEANPIPMKAKKQSNPNDIIFMRVRKFVRAVNASDGKSIRNNNCTNIGSFTFVGPEFSLINRSPFDIKAGIFSPPSAEKITYSCASLIDSAPFIRKIAKMIAAQ